MSAVFFWKVHVKYNNSIMSSITTLTISDIFKNMSNAFVGALADIYPPADSPNDPDHSIRVLMKENRYMYLALLLILIITVGNLFWTE